MTNWDKDLEAIDIESQLAKCAICPCAKVAGCISCSHFRKECADSDCSTGHINRTDNLALCSADDCVMTAIKLRCENDRMSKELAR